MKHQPRKIGCVVLISISALICCVANEAVTNIEPLNSWFEGSAGFRKEFEGNRKTEPARVRSTPHCPHESSAYADLFQKWLKQQRLNLTDDNCAELFEGFLNGETYR